MTPRAEALELGRLGVLAFPLRSRRLAAPARDAAAELEDAGYSAIWLPGGVDSGVFEYAANLLGATTRLRIASGVQNVWIADPPIVAGKFHRLEAEHPGRFILGLGVGHARLMPPNGPAYRRPLEKMEAYLSALGAGDPPVPRHRLVVGALGPAMLSLAAGLSAGAQTYLVPPEHTSAARQTLGPGRLLAPTQVVVLEEDPAVARGVARSYVARYLRLENYTRNLLRLGFHESDLGGGGSDSLIDAIVTWGKPDAVAQRIRDHVEAGADHVALQVIPAPGQSVLPMQQWRRLAEELMPYLMHAPIEATYERVEAS